MTENNNDIDTNDYKWDVGDIVFWYDADNEMIRQLRVRRRMSGWDYYDWEYYSCETLIGKQHFELSQHELDDNYKDAAKRQNRQWERLKKFHREKHQFYSKMEEN